MKTTIKNYPEIKDLVIDPELLKVRVNRADIEEEMDRELNYLAKKHGEMEDASSDHLIEESDVVMIRVKSEIDKFNKPMVPVSVGKNLYNALLEKSLIGMKATEENTIEIDGKPVAITILKVKTKSIPELTWDLVKDDVKADFPEITSLEEYKKTLEEMTIYFAKEDHFFSKVYKSLTNQILDQSEIYIDPDEFQAHIDLVKENDQMYAAAFDMTRFDYYRSEAEEWADLSDAEIDEQLLEMLTNDYPYEIYAKEIYLRDRSEDEVEKDYEEFIQGVVQEAGNTVEEARLQFSKDDFIMRDATGIANEKLMNLFLEKAEIEWSAE